MDSTSGQTGMLRYRTKETISMPYGVELWDGVLCWRAEYDMLSHVQEWEDRAVTGSLEAFLLLVNASDDQILEFTRTHGVLGIYPDVARDSKEGTPAGSIMFSESRRRMPWMLGQANYIEDPRIYRRMARVARYMLKALNFVQGKMRVDPKEVEAFRRTLASSSQWFSVDTPETAYRGVQKNLKAWSAAANLSVNLWQGDEMMSGQDFQIDFGTWEDGQQWDHAKEDGVGFDVGDYRLRSAHFMHTFPNGARPSPLFNVLFFQLLQKASLPEGSYFCSQCGGFYTYSETGRVEKGMTKPRNGRPVSFCKEDCHMEHRRKYEKEWKRSHRSKPTDS